MVEPENALGNEARNRQLLFKLKELLHEYGILSHVDANLTRLDISISNSKIETCEVNVSPLHPFPLNERMLSNNWRVVPEALQNERSEQERNTDNMVTIPLEEGETLREHHERIQREVGRRMRETSAPVWVNTTADTG